MRRKIIICWWWILTRDILTRLQLLKNRPSWFDFAKIRLSWGQNGNERIGSFAYTSMMSQGKNAVIGGKVYTGMLPSGYANADLKWETSEQTDFGIDLRFFIQGENLFTITDYTGYDPEVGTRNGLDGGTYPQARTYTIGANITF